MYKAMIASGMKLQNYGTVVVTLAARTRRRRFPLSEDFTISASI
jgi:hypothetical protein